ncbi:unnamed protein product [Sympodiomycopsis kandeliae]
MSDAFDRPASRSSRRGQSTYSAPEVDDSEDEDQGAFVKRREKDRRAQVILPHQNFLAPRRPGPSQFAYDSASRDGPRIASSSIEHESSARNYNTNQVGDLDPRALASNPQASYSRPSSSLSIRSPSPVPAYLYRRSDDADRTMSAATHPDSQQQPQQHQTTTGRERSSFETAASHTHSNIHYQHASSDPAPLSEPQTASSISHLTTPTGSHHLHQQGAGTFGSNTASREPLLPAKAVHTNYPREDHPLQTSATSHPSQQLPGQDSTPTTSTSQAEKARSAPFPSSPSPSKRRAKSQARQDRTPNPRLLYLWSRVKSPAGNPLAFLGSFALLLVLGGLWMGFEARYSWYHLSPAVPIVIGYTWLAAIVNMVVTAYQDPGTVPKDLDPDPPTTSPASRTRERHGHNHDTDLERQRDPDDPLYSPLPRIIRVRNGQDLTLKWCETCRVYRPPRSSHCRVCDVCIDGIDHHCTFLNTCIGRRNYTSFFAFLIFSLITCILCMIFSALHLKFLTLPPSDKHQGSDKSFKGALSTSPMSAVLFLLILAVFFPILTLFSYHLRLILMGRTTVEQIRINTTKAHSYSKEKSNWMKFKLGKPEEDPNPFAYRNPFRNCANVLCRPGVHTLDYQHYPNQQQDLKEVPK